MVNTSTHTWPPNNTLNASTLLTRHVTCSNSTLKQQRRPLWLRFICSLEFYCCSIFSGPSITRIHSGGCLMKKGGYCWRIPWILSKTFCQHTDEFMMPLILPCQVSTHLKSESNQLTLFVYFSRSFVSILFDPPSHREMMLLPGV